jgi:hypothetical protein
MQDLHVAHSALREFALDERSYLWSAARQERQHGHDKPALATLAMAVLAPFLALALLAIPFALAARF